MRILKGHVTMAMQSLELSMAVPHGMSGSPIFAGGRVVGYATATVRSEEVEDSVEETIETTDAGQVTRRTEVRRVILYGIGHSFHALAAFVDPILEGKSLPEFVRLRNDEA